MKKIILSVLVLVMLFNIIGVALVGTILHLVLKQTNQEIALLSSLVTCLIIVSMVLSFLSEIITKMLSYLSGLGVGSDIITYLIKILGISYVVEFMVDIAEEAGAGAIAGKVVLAGKVILAGLGLPILFDLVDMLLEVV